MVWLRMVLVLGVVAMGCDHVLYQRFDRQMWSSYIHLHDVKLGMSKSEVEGIMGPPGTKEQGDYHGGRYTFYFYLTHSMDFEDSDTVRNGYTPLVFQDNHLVGMGRRAYRMAVDRPEDGRFPGLPWTGVK